MSQQIIQKPLIIKWSTYLHISARLVSRFMLSPAPCNPRPRPRPGSDLLLIFKYKSCDPKLLLFSGDNIRMLTPRHGARLQCTQGMWAADRDQFHRSWVSQQIFLPFNVLSAFPSTLDTLCILDATLHLTCWI